MLLKIINEEHRKHHGEILKKLARIVEDGEFRPLIDPNRFTFDDVGESHQFLESKQAIGKIVLTNVW